jgi:hypothetical protein
VEAAGGRLGCARDGRRCGSRVGIVARRARRSDQVGRSRHTEEQQMVSLMDPDDRARYILQKRMSDRAQMAALLADIQAKRHEAAMSVINNIR